MVLNIFRKSGPLSITELSDTSGLSKTTIMKIVDYLLETGTVVSSGKGKSSVEGGKKPSLFQFNRTHGYVLSAQIFASELFSVITDLKADILEEISIPLKRNQDIGSIVDAIASSFQSLMKGAGIDSREVIAVVIGSHGVTDFERGTVVSSPHFSSWGAHVPLGEMIDLRLNLECPLYVDNWLRFQAYAELWKGRARGRRNFVVVDGGLEGLAAGIIAGGAIQRGNHFLSGEIGHTIVNPFETEPCVCGGKGCFENEVEIGKLIKRAEVLRETHPESGIFTDDRPVRPEDIFEAANAGDELAESLMQEIIRWYAVGLLNTVLVADPELIIIQGIYTKAGEFFRGRLERAVNDLSLVSIRGKIAIAYSALGKDRGVVGGAAYAVDRYFETLKV
jgi:predicted NBD/HSP70 family sugar kinase